MTERREPAWRPNMLGMFALAAFMTAGLLGSCRDPHAEAKETWVARGPLEQFFRARIAWLERFRLELDTLVLNAAPVQATTAEAAGSATIRTALEGGVRASSAPPLANASVYQDIDADEVSVPFVLLASAAGDGAPPLPKIPVDVLWRELEHADQTGGTTSLVWFSPDAGSGVRLNLVGTAMHEDTQTGHARLRLIHVSTPFAPRAEHAVEVRCGIMNGDVAPDRTWVFAQGVETSGSTQIDALEPKNTPRTRWVLESSAPRARVYVAEEPWWRSNTTRQLLMQLAILVLFISMWMPVRKNDASDPSPGAASSPAGEDPSAPPADS